MFLGRRKDDRCRVCHGSPETIGHILSACPAHEWTFMKWRHDRLLYVLVRSIFSERGIPIPNAYRELNGRAVPGNYGPAGEFEVAVDQLCPTKGTIAERRPDVLIRNFRSGRVTIMEVAAAYESCLETSEAEKRAKYQTLAADLAGQESGWRVRCVPVVVGDLGTVGRLKAHLEDADLFWPNAIETVIALLQREVVCASADMLCKHLLM